MVWALVRAERYNSLLRLLYVEYYEDKGAADVVGTSDRDRDVVGRGLRRSPVWGL